MFGFEISADGVVTRETEFRDEAGRTWTRHQRLAAPKQRIYFSQPGPVSWEPMKQARIRVMNDPQSS